MVCLLLVFASCLVLLSKDVSLQYYCVLGSLGNQSIFKNLKYCLRVVRWGSDMKLCCLPSPRKSSIVEVADIDTGKI